MDVRTMNCTQQSHSSDMHSHALLVPSSCVVLHPSTFRAGQLRPLMSTSLIPNAVESVKSAPFVVLLSPAEARGWCNQYSEEGYNVVHIRYPGSPLHETIALGLSMVAKSSSTGDNINAEFAIITYGLTTDDACFLGRILNRHASLKACIHYCPIVGDSGTLLVLDSNGKYIPTTVHIAASQERLHASLLALLDSVALSQIERGTRLSPLAVYTYPLVSSSPAFPLTTKAPAEIKPGESIDVDPHTRSATNMSYTRTLELLRRSIGPYFDLERIWGEHLRYEFIDRDALKTMSTMVKVPYVNHVPTLTGGVGFDELARFYKHHFTGEKVTPPDTEMITVSRTVGADRIVDEMIFRCTHTTEIDYFLPGIGPTGKRLEIALVGIIAFRGDKLCFEHIYWDQASALVQLGLLDPKGLPIAGIEVARKVLDPFGHASNELMERWKEREGLPAVELK